MHRTLLPKISILLLSVFAMSAGAQTRLSTEPVLTKCWDYPIVDTPARSLVSDGDRIFIAYDGAKIEALSTDGKKVWASELGGEIRSNVMPGATGLLVVTSTATTDAAKPEDFVLRSLSKETGITSWSTKLDKAEKFTLYSSEKWAILVSSAGLVEALDPKDGSVKWKREIAQKFVADPVFDKEDTTVAADLNQVFEISHAAGDIASMRKLSIGITALGRTPDDDVIAGNERGEVTLFVTGREKPYWKFKSGGEISQAGEAGGSIFAVSHDNFIYLLASRNGSVIWKKRMPGRISAVTTFLDRYIVVAGAEEHASLLLDIANGKVAGQIFLGVDETVSTLLPTARHLSVLTNRAAYNYSVDGCAK